MTASANRDTAVNWQTLTPFSTAFAAAAIERFEEHQQHIKQTKLSDRVRRSVQMYYLLARDGSWDETKINLSGDKAEIVNLAPATYRRIIQDRVSLVMQTPPDFEPLALNTDPESQSQCSLARGILDHYKREKNLEGLGVDRFEMASAMSASYTHVRWDYDAGPEDRLDEQRSERDGKTGQITKPVWIYKGDFVFSLRTLFDVAYDRTSPDTRRPRWWVVCEPEQRFDVLKHVEGEGRNEAEREKLRQAVLAAPKWSDRIKQLELESEEYRFDDTIPVYYVYIEASPSCPNGRKARVLNAEWVLADSDLDEDRAGVFPLWPCRVMTRNEPYTNHFGGMPIADAVGKQLSTIASNHKSFGLQRITTPREGNVTPNQIDSGLALLDYSAYSPEGLAVPPPTAFTGLQSPPELFTLLDILMKLQDTVQGGSPVHRGDPDATRGDSGSKAAMLYAAAQQIAAGDVRAKHESDADIASFIISSLKRHADTERVVSIVGKNQQYSARQFIGRRDLDKITRVHVRQANPARDTFSGRYQLAELLMQAKTPEEREMIRALIMTGNIDTITEDAETKRLLAERENETLLDPAQELPPVLAWDNHLQHIEEHGELLNDPETRLNPVLRKRVLEHNQLHVDALDPTSPRFAGHTVLLVTGQKPLPTDQMPGGAPQPGAPGAGPGKPPVRLPVANNNGRGTAPQASGPRPPAANDNGQSDGMPRQPSMPRNPATGEPVKMPAGAGGPGAPVIG